jgi:Na+-driven multidrug efflux pump
VTLGAALRRSPHDREILRLAVLALGALAAQPTFVLVDTAIVGHLGTPQLAALGIAGLVLGGAFAIFNFLAYGTTSQVTRAAGAGARETADRLGAQAFWLSFAIGTAVALAVGLAAKVRPPSTPSSTCRSLSSGCRSRFSCSEGRATSAASPTCARRS